MIEGVSSVVIDARCVCSFIFRAPSRVLLSFSVSVVIHGWFWAHPEQESHPLPGGEFSPHEVRCPICRFQVKQRPTIRDTISRPSTLYLMLCLLSAAFFFLSVSGNRFSLFGIRSGTRLTRSAPGASTTRLPTQELHPVQSSRSRTQLGMHPRRLAIFVVSSVSGVTVLWLVGQDCSRIVRSAIADSAMEV